jgi:D-serine deaminase-like pyridoxal phosphate-dependent protein
MNIIRPTLLLNEEVCRANIRRMAEKARQLGISFRPHFKTHQSHAVGRWFRAEGVNAITVSSWAMAEYFAADGWNDIAIAFPLNPREHDSINRLAQTITLTLTVSNAEALEQLIPNLHHALRVYIEIDTGYQRTGIAPGNTREIDAILALIRSNEKISFAGFLSHAGHSYKARSKAEILSIHEASKAKAVAVAAHYRADYPSLIVSVGDTPTCSVADDFSGVQEIRPGNFVFYDVTQQAIGSCQEENIAVALACPVVALYPERSEIVVHGGAVHASKDLLKTDMGVMYGRVVRLQDNGWSRSVEGAYVKSLSQEHGIIHATDALLQSVKPGDVLGMLPVHSCLMADAMKAYQTCTGEHLAMMH